MCQPISNSRTDTQTPNSSPILYERVEPLTLTLALTYSLTLAHLLTYSHSSLLFLLTSSITLNGDEQKLEGRSKHFIQYDSLIGHLDALTSLSTQYVYLEFGGGKGELSGVIHQLSPNSKKLIVDKAKLRHAVRHVSYPG